MVVTTAFKLPAVDGLVPKVIVNAVAVAAVTVPTAPLSNVTELSPAVVLNPKPLMVMVVALADRFAVLLVTTGLTDATWTAVPLELLLVVTTAVRLPAAVGFVENVTVKDVAVAELTVPTAPLLNTTTLFAAVVSKPNPEMVIVDALAAKASVFTLTTGTTLAIWIAEPLACAFVVTTAVKLPTAVGLVVNVTVKDVEVAAVTDPTAPLLNVTMLSSIVVLNPTPLITTVAALAAKLVVLLVTTGFTVATWTGAPLEIELVVTTAVRMSALAGGVVRDTVKDVAVAAVIAPTAPLLNVTELFASVVSNPTPVIVISVAEAARSAVLLVITGLTVATWTAVPLVSVLVVTIAVIAPAAVGRVDSVTVRLVSVAADTVPTAPLLNSTVLFAAVASKPSPLIVNVVASAPIS